MFQFVILQVSGTGWGGREESDKYHQQGEVLGTEAMSAVYRVYL